MAVLLYLGTRPDAGCPSVSDLGGAGFLDWRETTDAWGHAFRIACDGDDIVVRSDGPDGAAGTTDDIE